MGVAVFLLAFGACVLVGYRRTANVARASESWPSAWGTVVTSHVVPPSGDFGPKHAFEAVTPAAGGRRCFVVRFGHQRSPESLVAAYPVGASVLIHYDPDERTDRVVRESRAVIEAGSFSLSRLQRVALYLSTWGSIAGGVVLALFEVF